MKPENAIEVSHISKKFKVYMDKGHTLKEKMLFRNRRKYEERIVLDDISFEVEKGEAIGLIGQNGCGKSTTLKLLTRIMYPDSGNIEMCGRVSSLIELGAGFHPDMSGRQNIYTNASIFGLTRKEIEARFDDIVAFSELEEFIDNPVRTYSSGMYMRLAFSVAINVDADILLIDEILAVGDANFQAKCFNRLKEIKAKGVTIVIVSHSLSQIEEICERSLWIQNGSIKAMGAPRDIHPQYLDYMGEHRQGSNQKSTKEVTKIRWGNGDARIKNIATTDLNGENKKNFRTNDSLIIKIFYDVVKPVNDAVFGVGFFDVRGLQCYGTNTRIDQLPKFDLTQNGTVEINIPNLVLLPGEYTIDLAIESGMGVPVDYYTKAWKISVFSDISDVGITRIPHNWSLRNEVNH
ncbi:MAG: ABC transporter ATP-binding protein [Clostridiales bacterium]|nr:ABC transporter ATP-binding protein [Clostridiales bacterium]